MASLPDAPLLVIANEFFDALPARQFVRTLRGWCERRVGLTPDGDALAFGLDPEPDPRLAAEAPVGAVLTLPSQALAVMREPEPASCRSGGALLAIDYGYDTAAPTVPAWAIRSRPWRAIASPIRCSVPGEADLTLHVDFGALARAAMSEGASIQGPVTQRDFLLSLGLDPRAEAVERPAPRRLKRRRSTPPSPG